MRKFTSHIIDEALIFEENPVPYNLEYLIKKENKASTDKNAGAITSKKTNLYEQYKGDLIIVN